MFITYFPIQEIKLKLAAAPTIIILLKGRVPAESAPARTGR